MDLVHNYLIPAIKSEKALPANSGLNNQMEKRQTTLALKPPMAEMKFSELESRISGKEFDLTENSNDIQSVYLTFNGEECSTDTFKRYPCKYKLNHRQGSQILI